MSNTLFNNHPLINNSNQYFLVKKYISIHSEDRDVTKYPNPSEFEIMLPQEYLNVASARLYSWSFPANYNVFSVETYNVNMTFRFVSLYNPGEFNVSDELLEGIFAALYSFQDREFIVTIEPGFYNPDQMAIELTNKFNELEANYKNLKVIQSLSINEISYRLCICPDIFTRGPFIKFTSILFSLIFFFTDL